MKGGRIRYQRTGEHHFLAFSFPNRQLYLSPVADMKLFQESLPDS